MPRFELMIRIVLVCVLLMISAMIGRWVYFYTASPHPYEIWISKDFFKRDTVQIIREEDGYVLFKTRVGVESYSVELFRENYKRLKK